MGIAAYIKEIGRGKAGARSLSREQAAGLMGQLLDGVLSDLEVGAFCLAMRVKGESTDEMLGFLDAVHRRIDADFLAFAQSRAWVVLPSYNGARKLPVLTPLLAGLLAREGVSVLVHGLAEPATVGVKRTTTAAVWRELGWAKYSKIREKNPMDSRAAGLFYAETADWSPAVAQLLAVRNVVGVRNSAHSLVKLCNPTGDPGSLVVGSYTHPEYFELMGNVFSQVSYPSMLLRGTEGEPVADARRCPQMEVFANGERTLAEPAQTGSLATVPDLPQDCSAAQTAQYTADVLSGQCPVPAPIATQVSALVQAMRRQAA